MKNPFYSDVEECRAIYRYQKKMKEATDVAYEAAASLKESAQVSVWCHSEALDLAGDLTSIYKFNTSVDGCTIIISGWAD